MVDHQKVIAALDGLNLEDVANDSTARGQILAAAHRLTARLELPYERMMRWTWSHDDVIACCRIVHDVGLWKAWLEAGGKETTVQELVDLCNPPCDLVLLRRIFRLLAAEHVVIETPEGRYRSTPLSLELGNLSSPVLQCLFFWYHHNADSAKNFPFYLARESYPEPLDPLKSNYMDLTPENMSFFQRCASKPEYQESFTVAMTGYTQLKMDWTEVYDTKQMVEGFSGDGPLVVDMGAGQGPDLQKLLARHPDLPASALVLQDLPEVISTLVQDLKSKVTVQEHDFFTPQPIQGSPVYFMHAVLHDWDDIDARRILNSLRSAMKPGVSKLLVYEVLIPTVGATWLQCSVDFNLMHLLAAAERTEEKWRLLLEGEGLRVIKIWSHPSSPESVIEAELA
ncbi:S-adenosyl-L-methionine-dependent methyltransferase [Pseudomassariella vexata]|uniref:S-adenosyl-L-methionine-dependent methyltransferase n=1 Tax=Pseudomassariella vexata TaxID=1141098 RepID=A0A1Y2EFZ1_9PEZI|nr:S-adenosyl-L-methionine-dependent methyltransferase [Pseudomassariella vexata]ORY70498.1 S-adenosyl-L-methionine-dependent methyltransferase [Pseudomassariella vexata]